MPRPETIAWLAELAPGAISPAVAAQAQRELDAEAAARPQRPAAPAQRPRQVQTFLAASAGRDDRPSTEELIWGNR